MSPLTLNLVLMLAWAVIKSDTSTATFFQGFILGWLILSLTRPMLGNQSYFSKPLNILKLCAYFIKELFVSNIKVLWDILTPQHNSKPAIIKVPLDIKTDTQLLLLSNLICLTPGTLVIDVSEDKQYLLVHVMFMEDEKKTIASIKEDLEQKILKVTSS